MKKYILLALASLLFFIALTTAICRDFWGCLPTPIWGYVNIYGPAMARGLLIFTGIMILLTVLVRKKAKTFWTLTIILVILLITGTTFFFYGMTAYYQFAIEERKQASNLDFDLYVPEYTPQGFNRTETRIESSTTRSPHLQIDYYGPELSSKLAYILYAYVYNRTEYPYPNDNCGLPSPDRDHIKGLVLECVEIGKTPNGTSIYITNDDIVNIVYGNTRILIGGYKPSKEELLKLARSLKKVSPEEIDFKTPFR